MRQPPNELGEHPDANFRPHRQSEPPHQSIDHLCSEALTQLPRHRNDTLYPALRLRPWSWPRARIAAR